MIHGQAGAMQINICTPDRGDLSEVFLCSVPPLQLPARAATSSLMPGDSCIPADVQLQLQLMYADQLMCSCTPADVCGPAIASITPSLV